jgi:HK97 gp10 family phage protein
LENWPDTSTQGESRVTIDELSSLMSRVSEVLKQELPGAVKHVCEKVAEDARNRLGHYSQAGYPTWVPLAEVTRAKRTAMGYTPDDPLLMSSELHASIEVKEEVVNDQKVRYGVGSDLDYAATQELGRGGIPARPFLAPALMNNTDEIQKVVKEILEKAFGD